MCSWDSLHTPIGRNLLLNQHVNTDTAVTIPENATSPAAILSGIICHHKCLLEMPFFFFPWSPQEWCNTKAMWYALKVYGFLGALTTEGKLVYKCLFTVMAINIEYVIENVWWVKTDSRVLQGLISKVPPIQNEELITFYASYSVSFGC